METKNVKQFVFSMGVLGAFVFSSTAQADIIVYKAYKQTFPDAHPKCIDCHVDAMPKKAEGQHEWNAYGLAVKKAAKDAGIADVPTADDASKLTAIFSKIGKMEDFKESGK
jgi:hypothetical protein